MKIQLEEVRKAVKGMKQGKAAGPTELTLESITSLGKDGMNWLLEIFDKC